ncbi:MAG TPA: YkgJ family cysteine cluster protein [archaeon]|nr:YkgJ family cysteine cluster protein [archaeon]
MINFVCNKCGDCCRNLLKNIGDVINGLTLFPDEVHLFPKEIVSPSVAIGHTPTKIISYQLNVETCPHLKNNECSLHDQKPLICRAFPLTVSPTFNIQSEKSCPLLRNAGEKIDFNGPEEEEAVKKLENRFMDLAETAFLPSWCFDLRTKKWIKMD